MKRCEKTSFFAFFLHFFATDYQTFTSLFFAFICFSHFFVVTLHPISLQTLGENQRLLGVPESNHLIGFGKNRNPRGPRQNLQSNVLVRISESSGSPKAIARLVLGKIGGTRRLNERGAVSPCDRVADDFVPFHRAIIEPLSMHYRSNNEINCCQLLIIVDHFFFVCKLLVIVDNC